MQRLYWMAVHVVRLLCAAGTTVAGGAVLLALTAGTPEPAEETRALSSARVAIRDEGDCVRLAMRVPHGECVTHLVVEDDSGRPLFLIDATRAGVVFLSTRANRVNHAALWASPDGALDYSIRNHGQGADVYADRSGEIHVNVPEKAPVE